MSSVAYVDIYALFGGTILTQKNAGGGPNSILRTGQATAASLPLQCWTNNLFPLDHSLTQCRGATLAIPQGLGATLLVV